jgi:hypothetical protein
MTKIDHILGNFFRTYVTLRVTRLGDFTNWVIAYSGHFCWKLDKYKRGLMSNFAQFSLLLPKWPLVATYERVPTCKYWSDRQPAVNATTYLGGISVGRSTNRRGIEPTIFYSFADRMTTAHIRQQVFSRHHNNAKMVGEIPAHILVGRSVIQVLSLEQTKCPP